LRESLFNILIHALTIRFKMRACSTCSPATGALGVEAISRGAAFALFVDNGAEARALLRNNVESLAWAE